MNGGTILEHHNLVNWFLRDNVPDAKLSTCTIESGLYEQKPKYRSRAKKHSFHRVEVESLFVMDREQFLPIVTSDGDFRVEIDDRKLEDVMNCIECMG